MTGQRLITCAELDELLQALRREGYSLVGPRERDGAITYDEIEGVEQLPMGVTDEQAPGRYRLRRGSNELFGFAAPAQSFKRYFHPPRQRLFSLRRGAKGPELVPASSGARRLALIGARGCDLAGLDVLDGVLATGTSRDEAYVERRSDVFVVGLNCGVAGGTCFCTSMGTGPGVSAPFDLALTELPGEASSTFVVDVGSDRGRRLLDQVPGRAATEREIGAAERRVTETAAQIHKRLDGDGLKALLASQRESAHWQQVAERCLGCANCTMVCPTCFCSNVVDEAGWDGEAARDKTWDSCFTEDFSTIHGGPVRQSTAGRYRQWLTHKLGTWHDQFGRSGCVGCGRCVTWCPVGIDITEEIAALRIDAATRSAT